MTPHERFLIHAAKWANCQACPLCTQRDKIVLARGVVPCDVMFCGEAPGECITGDSLVEVAYRDKKLYPDGVPIMDLVGKSGFKVYSCVDGRLTLGNVSRVWSTGEKETYEVKYFWWGAPPDGKGGRQKYYESLRVTSNHPFLLKDGTYKSIDSGLVVGSRLQPFYRHRGKRNMVGLHSTNMQKEHILLMEHKLGRPLVDDEQVHHNDRNKWNDTYDNLVLLSLVEHARLHGLEDNAMFDPVHKETHRQVMESEEYRQKQSIKMKEVLSDPKVYAERLEQLAKSKYKIAATLKNKYDTDPQFYYNYLKGRRFKNGGRISDERIEELVRKRFPNSPYPPTVENHEIISIDEMGVQEVYDMEVDDHHNFAVNGIFVHNSENVHGLPFWGPAGDLLESIMVAVRQQARVKFTEVFVNLVACFPALAKQTDDHRPAPEEIEACAPRLREFVEIAQPKLVVCVGDTAKDWVRHILGAETAPHVMWCDILHPAYILGRLPQVQKSMATQQCVKVILNAVERAMGVTI